MIVLWFLLLLFSLQVTVIASQTLRILGDTVAPTSQGAGTVLMAVTGQEELGEQGLKRSNPPCTKAGPRFITTKSPSVLCEGGKNNNISTYCETEIQPRFLVWLKKKLKKETHFSCLKLWKRTEIKIYYIIYYKHTINHRNSWSCKLSQWVLLNIAEKGGIFIILKSSGLLPQLTGGQVKL